jgi:hypothetical protein
MLSSQEEEAERKAVLENDLQVLRQQQQKQQEQAGTFFSHAQAAANDTAGGRFAAVNAAKVVGQSPAIAASYPAASAAHQTELPPEPSLGFSIDEMPGLESSMAAPLSSSVEATGDPADAPSSDDGSPATPSGGSMSERAGSSPSQVGDPAGVHFPSPPDTSRDVDAGSSSNKRSE